MISSGPHEELEIDLYLTFTSFGSSLWSEGPDFLTLFNTQQNLPIMFSAYPLFSVWSACFSFQGCVLEHISPNVKLISDNKYQSSGISIYKVQPVRENDAFVQHLLWLPWVCIFCFWSYSFWREVGKRQGMVGNLQASHLIIHICITRITNDLILHRNLFGAEWFKRKPKLQNRQNLGNPR